jgi:hypothetical protein
MKRKIAVLQHLPIALGPGQLETADPGAERGGEPVDGLASLVGFHSVVNPVHLLDETIIDLYICYIELVS